MIFRVPVFYESILSLGDYTDSFHQPCNRVALQSALLGHALVSLSKLQCGKYPCFCNCACLDANNAAAMTAGVILDVKAATTQRRSTWKVQFEYLSTKAPTVQCCYQSMLAPTTRFIHLNHVENQQMVFNITASFYIICHGRTQTSSHSPLPLSHASLSTTQQRDQSCHQKSVMGTQ